MPIQRDEIIEIANKLFIYTDERDWEKVKAIFADEVLFDMTSIEGRQPAKMKPQEIV